MVSHQCTCVVDLTDQCIVISGSFLVHPVLLCVMLLHCVMLCYTVLFRITSGPFDQEVISSSLTLEYPDLKVRESTSLVSMATGLSSESDPTLSRSSVTRRVTQNTRPSFSTDSLLRGHDL